LIVQNKVGQFEITIHEVIVCGFFREDEVGFWLGQAAWVNPETKRLSA
jgi:hypothetical protein